MNHRVLQVDVKGLMILELKLQLSCLSYPMNQDVYTLTHKHIHTHTPTHTHTRTHTHTHTQRRGDASSSQRARLCRGTSQRAPQHDESSGGKAGRGGQASVSTAPEAHEAESHESQRAQVATTTQGEGHQRGGRSLSGRIGA